MNKKILYVAFVDFEQKHYGVNKKIFSQAKSLEKLGYEVEIVARRENNIITVDSSGEEVGIIKSVYKVNNKKIKNFYYKQAQYQAIVSHVSKNDFYGCYIRYDLSGSGFIKFLKDLKESLNKIIIEIPTYPYENEYRISFLHKLKLKVDTYYRKKMKKYVDRIVTYYDEDTIFEIPTIKTINGISFDEILPVTNLELNAKEINLIAVSSMRSWHAYERIIEGLNIYTKNQNDKKYVVNLHLVGEGPDIPLYIDLVKKNNLDDYVFFYGNQSGRQLDSIFEDCVLGIDSLGRHRTNISVLSSLKSREYGAKGIPIINSCKIDVDDNQFKYILYVPADETPIDINSIIDFYERIYSQGKKNVIKETRSFFEKKASMDISMKKIGDFLNS